MTKMKDRLKQAEDAAWNNFNNFDFVQRWMIENGYLIMFSHDESDPLTPAKNIVKSIEKLLEGVDDHAS